MISGKINGLSYVKYGYNSKIPIVFFCGMNIVPGSRYLDLFPSIAVKSLGELIVVYQEGVSGNLLKTGLYSEETERRQLKAALELVENRSFVPVTHSYSGILGMKLLNYDFRKKNDAENALPGVITSVFTTVEDAFVDNSEIRRIFGIPALSLFKVGRYLPLLLPVYPLRDANAHSGFGVNVKEDVASPWINSRSANYCFKSEELEMVVDQVAIGIITLQDRIFSYEEQEKKYKKLGAKIRYVNSGHRWMTSKRSCEMVVLAINEQLRKH